ncbi:hypothetical protein NEUTE1DRAFT_42309 [Neurospora tetrasperma FGSC 2508]|uniref:Uncharacterized protein n=1 Tax=Neurospora tetrasperma (strain FGSC 2508 / ATCC MYA-4615 / P0657) TaxID=510951 RepID=F8MMP8_NEUT8|nr:uncharacterized protein NEUTE1DRAFT_42309 [Neurospora tetrasperma FGSC 2508]EGO57922.1 hypothetical protein NEUTE1DRAFT_42309 [Neurospora tetrasperma FGSC 2508]EGZ71787.1 hypothetical protein NEUTE2DRAFT_66981 [Neurospora tetrasperma FGSC 2509]
MPLKVGAPMMHETCNTTPPTFDSPPSLQRNWQPPQNAELPLFRRTSLSADFGNTSQMRHRIVAKNLFLKRELIDTPDAIDLAGFASHIRTIGALQVLHATTNARSTCALPLQVGSDVGSGEHRTNSMFLRQLMRPVTGPGAIEVHGSWRRAQRKTGSQPVGPSPCRQMESADGAGAAERLPKARGAGADVSNFRLGKPATWKIAFGGWGWNGASTLVVQKSMEP